MITLRESRLPAALLAASLLILLLFAGAARSEATGQLRELPAVTDDDVQADTGRVIVRFVPGTDRAAQTAAHASLNARVVDTLDGLALVVVEAPNAAATEALAAAYDRRADVEFATPDALMPLADTEVTPNDLYYSLQWEHDAIDSPEAWATTTGDAQRLITVCDTGVSATHPDIVANLRGDLGTNTAGRTNDWSPVHYHGTAVAGAAAAAGNNAIGVSGVNWTAGIIPVRVTDRADGNASLSALAACIEYGADQGSTAINLSYTTYTNGEIDPVILAAADYAEARGSLLVIAAGNSNRDDAPTQDPEHILYVAATAQGNGKASFSNFGNSIDIAAPGESVVSTYSQVSCRGQNCSVVAESYAFVSGTSFAAPIVAGAVALTANAHDSAVEALTPADRPAFLRGLLAAGACDLGAPGEDPLFGAGLLNVHSSVHGSSCLNPVPAPSVDSVLVSPLLAEMYVGGTQQFTATALWTDGSSTDVTGDVEWTTAAASIATIDASGLATAHAAGLTNVSATLATADGPVVGTTSLLVSEAPPVGSVASATAISYSTSGGRNQDRNLNIKVLIEDDLGQPIAGASVEIALSNADTGQLWSGPSDTGSDGQASFSLKNAPAGSYSTIVVSVTADGYVWDGVSPPADPFVK